MPKSDQDELARLRAENARLILDREAFLDSHLRWNIEETDDGLRICRGKHEKGCKCEWEYYINETHAARLTVAHRQSADRALEVAEGLQDRAFRAEARAARLEEELRLAVAHDRQPYPTAEAYEKVCSLLHEAKAHVARLEESARTVLDRSNYAVLHRDYERMQRMPLGDARWDLRDRLPDYVLAPYSEMHKLADALNQEGGEHGE